MSLALLLILGLGPAEAFASDRAADFQAPLAVTRILAQTLESSDQVRRERRALRWSFDHAYQRQKLRDGKPVDQIRDLFRVYPRNGEHLYELVERNGRPAGAADLEREARLRKRFRKQVRRDEGSSRGRTGFEIDADLLARFRMSWLRRDRIDGRLMYVLRFEPIDAHAPIRRRVDYALNKSTGELWIDAEDYQPARIEFRLLEPVKIWAGLAGSVPMLEGRLDLERVEPGLWLPRRMKIQSEGRVLFSSVDQIVSLEWSGFERSRALAPQ